MVAGAPLEVCVSTHALSVISEIPKTTAVRMSDTLCIRQAYAWASFLRKTSGKMSGACHVLQFGKPAGAGAFVRSTKGTAAARVSDAAQVEADGFFEFGFFIAEMRNDSSMQGFENPVSIVESSGIGRMLQGAGRRAQAPEQFVDHLMF